MANLLHTKGTRTQIYKTLPSNSVGNDGDIILSQIQGKGVYLCSKVNGRWHVSTKMEELRKIEKTSIKDLKLDRVRVGNTTITKDEYDVSYGDFTLDVAGNIVLEASTSINSDAPLKIKEAAAAVADTAAYGQLWVKTATPNELYFTTDAGNDIQITSGSSITTISTEAIQDIVGAMFTGNTETRISATYQDGDNNIDLVVDDMTADTNTNQLTTFVVEDGDGNEVTIRQGNEWKFVEGTGIDIDWTDISDGTDADPYDLTITCDLEGTELKSTGEGGGSKFLREDGDGTCSWQTISAGASALNDLSDVTYSSGDLTISSLDTIISGSLALDSSGDITLDADGDQVTIKFGGATGQIDFTNENSGDGVIQQKVDAKDLVVKQYDGDEVVRFTDGGDVKVTNVVYFAAETANTCDSSGGGASATIDWNISQKQKLTITGTSNTINFTNPAGPCNLQLKIVQGDGSDTITAGHYSANVKWAGGARPTLSTANGAIDIVSFYFDGTSYHGVASLNFATI